MVNKLTILWTMTGLELLELGDVHILYYTGWGGAKVRHIMTGRGRGYDQLWFITIKGVGSERHGY